MINPVNPEEFYNQHKEAAGEAALVELKMRLLADREPELRVVANKNLEILEKTFIEWANRNTLSIDPDLIAKVRQLRNKILHADFPAARVKLDELGRDPASAKVKQVDVSVLNGHEMAKNFKNLAEDDSFVFTYGADTQGSERHVYGWFLELGASGALVEAKNTFMEMSAALDRLARSSPKKAGP